MYKLAVKKLDPRAKRPEVAHPGEDLGYDVFALEDTTLYPGPNKVRTGIAVSAYEEIDSRRFQKFIKVTDHVFGVIRIPMGLIVKDRSSMADKGVFTCGGVIDAGYRGEIKVMLNLPSKNAVIPYLIKAGDKIAQMAPAHVLTGVVEETDELPEMSRGEAGFGSSGK